MVINLINNIHAEKKKLICLILATSYLRLLQNLEKYAEYENQTQKNRFLLKILNCDYFASLNATKDNMREAAKIQQIILLFKCC